MRLRLTFYCIIAAPSSRLRRRKYECFLIMQYRFEQAFLHEGRRDEKVALIIRLLETGWTACQFENACLFQDSSVG